MKTKHAFSPVILVIFLFSVLMLQSGIAGALVIQVSPSILNTNQLIDFEDLPTNTSFNNVFRRGPLGLGMAFGERFDGQSLSNVANYDVLTGGPTASQSLTLLPGALDQNLQTTTVPFADTVLSGLGPLGFPDPAANGEGALSALFDTRVNEFGFELTGINPIVAPTEALTIQFFNRFGGGLGTLVLNNLSNGPLAFRDQFGNKTIAGFSIFNGDISLLNSNPPAFENSLVTGGFAVDDFRYFSVPEIGTLALLGIGLGGLGFIRRRRAIA